jgi:hypothetical protein
MRGRLALGLAASCVEGCAGAACLAGRACPEQRHIAEATSQLEHPAALLEEQTSWVSEEVRFQVLRDEEAGLAERLPDVRTFSGAHFAARGLGRMVTWVAFPGQVASGLDRMVTRQPSLGRGASGVFDQQAALEAGFGPRSGLLVVLAVGLAALD